ncbi:hypothetical protein VTO73DRAFT_2099 [Trametes versicolor]
MRSLGLELTVPTSSRAHAASWASDNATPGSMDQDGRAPHLTARTEQKVLTSFRSISWVDWTTKRRNRPLRVGPAPSPRMAAPAHSAAPGTSPPPLAGMCEDVARRGRRGAEAGGRLRENRRFISGAPSRRLGAYASRPAIAVSSRPDTASLVSAHRTTCCRHWGACKVRVSARYAHNTCHCGPSLLTESVGGGSSTIPAVPRTHRLLRLRSSVHAFADTSVVASAACKATRRLRRAAGPCRAGPVPSPPGPNGSPQAPKNKTACLRDHDTHALHSAPRSEPKEN